MALKKTVMFLAVILAIQSATRPSVTAEEFRAIDNTGQMFGRDLEAALSKLSLNYRRCFWPSQEEISQKSLPLAGIPSDVLDSAEAWIKRVVKPEWVPPQLKQRLTAVRIFMPYIPPHDVDYLIVRYETVGHQIQIMEDGAGVRVLVAPPGPGAKGEPPSEYIAEVANRYLAFPQDRINKMNLKLNTLPFGADSTLTYGTMECEDRKEPVRRLWWHQVYVWSDGHIVYFALIESKEDDKPEIDPSFGIRPRFQRTRIQRDVDEVDFSKPMPPSRTETPKPPTPRTESAKAPAARRVLRRVNPIDGAEMVYIPGAAFQMGGDTGDTTKPVHEQRVEGFWMYAKEVTNAQFRRFIQANPEWSAERIQRKHPQSYEGREYLKHWREETPSSKADEYPVVFVTWNAAKAYAEWAGGRLPTEMEWEYASRGGTQMEQGRTDEEWGRAASDWIASSPDGPRKGTRPVGVGGFPPNQFGLHDMEGNAGEWCSSLYKAYPYSATDGREDLTVGGERVLRAGGNSDFRRGVWPSSHRWGLPGNQCTGMLGFRCVVLGPKQQ